MFHMYLEHLPWQRKVGVKNFCAAAETIKDHDPTSRSWIRSAHQGYCRILSFPTLWNSHLPTARSFWKTHIIPLCPHISCSPTIEGMGPNASGTVLAKREEGGGLPLGEASGVWPTCPSLPLYRSEMEPGAVAWRSDARGQRISWGGRASPSLFLGAPLAGLAIHAPFFPHQLSCHYTPFLMTLSSRTWSSVVNSHSVHCIKQTLLHGFTFEFPSPLLLIVSTIKYVLLQLSPLPRLPFLAEPYKCAIGHYTAYQFHFALSLPAPALCTCYMF